MRRETRAPAIPAIPPEMDPRVRVVLEPVKEILELREGRRGAPGDRVVTWRDLVRLGLAGEEDLGR